MPGRDIESRLYKLVNLVEERCLKEEEEEEVEVMEGWEEEEEEQE